jgi:signal transduction histidine kinase
MRRHRIIGTISFRLSALYLGLFFLSFIIVGFTVYLLSQHMLEQQMRNGVEWEISDLADEYKEGGLKDLKDEIEGKSRVPAEHTYEYGIQDRDGNVIAGNIGQFMSVQGWQIVTVQHKAARNGKFTELLSVKALRLDDKYWLGVGFDTAYLKNAEDAVIASFSWGTLLLLVLGGAGGYYLSRNFLKKIEGITQSTQAIIGGDLKHRLTVSQNRDELDNLALLLNRMMDEIGKLIENVQQVSNDIAHDLRTPISRLKNRLEDAAQKDLSPAQYKERIAGAIEELDGILGTFTALLRIAQIESGSRRSSFKKVDFSQLVHSVADALIPVAEEKGKALETAIDAHVVLTGDGELLTQMVFNLVENAIIHSAEKAAITLGLHDTGKQIELTIADTGPGVPAEMREKIFQRFYRMERSRTTPGNGLGLSIVAAIAELHQARIEVDDNKPGLKITVSFAKK